MLKKRVQPEIDWSIPPKDDPNSATDDSQPRSLLPIPRRTRRMPPWLGLAMLGVGLVLCVLLAFTSPHITVDHLSVAAWLAVFGGFSLFGALAMWARTDYAESYGEPDPFASPGYPADRLSWWGRGELARAPMYRGMMFLFLGLGLLLLLAAGVAVVVSLLA